MATPDPARALDMLKVALALAEAAGDRKIPVETKLLRWLVERARLEG